MTDTTRSAAVLRKASMSVRSASRACRTGALSISAHAPFSKGWEKRKLCEAAPSNRRDRVSSHPSENAPPVGTRSSVRAPTPALWS